MRNYGGLNSQNVEILWEILRFLTNDPLRKKIKNSVPKVFIATPIDVVVFKFREISPTGNLWNRALFTWQKNNKISPASQTVATARNAPKISQGHSEYLEWSRFHPNRFSFCGVIAERVNTAKSPRKVNLIFGWSLSSSRISSCNWKSGRSLTFVAQLRLLNRQLAVLASSR